MGDAPLMLGVSGLRGIAGESLTPDLAVRYAGAFGAWLARWKTQRLLQDRPESSVAHVIAPTVAVARDGRVGGEVYYHAAVAGLLGAGCRVVELGVCPTPTAGWFVGQQCDGGMMVTASHNPQEWNGLKCFVADEFPTAEDLAEDLFTNEYGRAPFLEEAQEIIRIFHGDEGDRGPAWRAPDVRGVSGVHLGSADAAHDHWRDVFFRFFGQLDPASQEQQKWGFHAVVDAVNASGSRVSVPFLEYVGRCTPLYCSDSGVFPHTPEPTEENLSGAGGLTRAVPGLGADVGFAQDPDADRLAIIDETGGYIGEEYTLVFAAMALLEAERDARRGSDAPPPTGEQRPVVVVNLSTSRMIDDVCAHYGAEVVRTPVGEANVVAAMLRLARQGRRVILGGEGNGGVIWPEISLVRDSLAAIALTLALMARTGDTVCRLVERVHSLAAKGKKRNGASGTGSSQNGGYAIVKHKADLARKEDARPGLDRIVARYAPGSVPEGAIAERFDTADCGPVVVDRQDGVRIDFLSRFPSGPAWVHVRASNTEPILRVIAEAAAKQDADALAKEIGELVR